ncbi:hypothetical protein ABPG74_019673 [Tetrahymena malaccensis]
MERVELLQNDQLSLNDIYCLFQEKVQEVFKFEQKDLSSRLLEILNSDNITVNDIQQKFSEMQDIIKLIQITQIAIDYQIMYKNKKRKEQNNLPIYESKFSHSSKPFLIQNQQENSYQSIFKNGTDKICEMFSLNSENLAPFIEYLSSHVDKIDFNNQEFQQILENLNWTLKQTKQILQIWEPFRLELQKINQKNENSDLVTQFQMKNYEQSLYKNSHNLIQNINISNNQFNLTQSQLGFINQNTAIAKTEFQYNDITLKSNLFSSVIQYETFIKRDKELSQIYTLVYQQQDCGLDQASLKVICDYQQILNLINNLKQDQVKTIAFYGDFKLSMKIISQYYFKNPEWINQASQNSPPQYDKLVAITDGQLVFLILQEQKESFEGDINQNQEGLLFVRFLLDCCPIFITCLNQKQVRCWSDINPFQEFEAIVLPTKQKSRSNMDLNQISIKSSQQQKGNTLLSSDQNNCIIMSEYRNSQVIDNNKFQSYVNEIEQNKKFICTLFEDNKLCQNTVIENIHQRKHLIKKIFDRDTCLQQQIEQIYQQFENKITQLQKEYQENYFVQNILQLPRDQSQQFLKQLEKQVIYNHNQNEKNKFSLQTLRDSLQDSICKNCKLLIEMQVRKEYGCQNCQADQIIVDNIRKKIDKIRMSSSKNMNFNSLDDDESNIIKEIKAGLNINQSLNFKQHYKYLYKQNFFTHFKNVQNEVLNNLFSPPPPKNLQYEKKIVNIILDFILCTTYEIMQKIVVNRGQVNQQLIKEKDNFLFQIDYCFTKMKELQEKRIFVHPLQLTYDPFNKEALLSINYKIKYFILNDQAHKLVDYISFDEQVDYIVFNNSNEPDKTKHKTLIYKLRKNKLNSDLEYTFTVAGCLDLCLFINQYSRQWVIFNNDLKRNSFGKISPDYSFEEGRIDVNVYEQQMSNGNTIQRVDQCIILNEKNNIIILYEKQKKQFYELFLSGQLKEIKFDLNEEVYIDGNFKLQSIPINESGYIQSVKNSSEGDFYIFQTDKFLFLTNSNYTVKNKIQLKQNFSNFKLIVTDTSVLIVILYKNNNQECYIIQGEKDYNGLRSISNQSEESNKIGNILIDKMIKSLVHYGGNNEQIGCPNQVEQLFYYETSLQESSQNLKNRIEKYFNDCLQYKRISFKITCSQINCFNNINQLLSKLDYLIQTTNSISCQDLQFILQTRVPIQITTIQQASYLPLKDGLFQQDLMNVPQDENQIEQIKKKISFGWIENLVESQNKQIYVVSIGGRQSVGKSAQLNRLFGTRFGVSASRCTDGIWIGLSKVKDKLILVLDCEGLFSIRRSDDEEVKLLLQITSISDITMIFCDIEGFNQPLLSLFKKLQICSGKLQSDSFFQGTMVLLTKNIQDEGDRKKLLQESESHLNKKEIKNVFSNIFRDENGGIAYGFLKNYLSNDYDFNLQNVRDKLLYEGILFKKQPKNPNILMNILKYSMIQIYLNDDQDIDLISKQAEIKEIYNNFIGYFFDISKQTFINDQKLINQFEYMPTENQEKQLINYKSVFRYENIHKQSLEIQENQQKELLKPSNFDQLNSIYNRSGQIKYGNQEINQMFLSSIIQDQELNSVEDKKSHNILILNQCHIKLSPNQLPHKKSLNFERLEYIFFQCFNILQRANFNNYVLQMQKFFNAFIEQRRNTIKQYFQNRMPKDLKYASIVHSFEQELFAQIHTLDKQITICQQKCNKCNRHCVNVQGHQGNCDCETSHKCFLICEICNKDNECFLISGHTGTHYCNEMNHLCQKGCQISKSCKILCTLRPHEENVLHNCQSEHKCEYRCRLYDKCGKTCSLKSGHQEDNHLCDSTQCYEKCQLCNKLCGINIHDHDILISNIQKNKHLLTINGKLVSQHLCGNSHSCLNQCQFPGVCSITYKAEEYMWKTKTSNFQYLFIRPSKQQKNCNIKIQPWDINHEGRHECDSVNSHRCDQQCPECLSYCAKNYNHPGNHMSKNHRNKEKCVFISQSNQIKINSIEGNIRYYQPGEKSTPENCFTSCLRMGRAHTHLRVCQGGDLCAEKKYPFARHSNKQYNPYTHLTYDEMLCKGYWNSINWEPPADEENLQIIQKCNVGCSHESHQDKPNYCTKQAWHKGNHSLDPKQCDHLGSSYVDICFTIDTTSSMDWAMGQVSQTINDIVKKFEGKADIKYSIVSYRDHPPQDNSYVYNIDSQLTDRDNILKVLNKMNADGGGDFPEAVMDGLYHSITSIKWRNNSQRFIFHICDSPPHGLRFGYKSKDPQWTEKGCPCGIHEKLLALLIQQKNIFYYLVQINDYVNLMGSIFQSLFGPYFKQSIQLEDTSQLNIEILQALYKEINTTNEFYHVEKQQII